MTLLLVLLIILLLLGCLERCLHLRRQRAVPVRIHVNGIRGKSGVTRLIAAGLRAGGLRVLAKTTGTEARLILEDGSEKPYRRAYCAGPPAISEQKRLVALAARRGLDVLVTECMAVQPEIQHVAENFFVRSQIGVITNIRLDHTDVMGAGPTDIATCLALTIPEKGRLVLGPSLLKDSEAYTPIAQAAARRQTQISQADLGHLPEDLEPGSVFFAENTAIALEVCGLLGVSERSALAGMREAQADPGSYKQIRAEFAGRGLILIDAFSANDPESTRQLWNKSLELAEAPQARIVGLFTNRADRGYRVELFAEHFLQGLSADANTLAGMESIAILGEGLLSAKAAFKRAGRKTFLPFTFGQGSVPALLRKLNRLFPDDKTLLLFGFGNSKGMGNRISKWFAEHGRPGFDQGLPQRAEDPQC